MKRSTDGRAQRCDYCNGMVRKPSRKQHPTLAETMDKHLAVCPGRKP